jgi:predicted transcriptional regulator
LNITFELEKVSLLSSIAKKEKRSVSSVAKELIRKALEKREDRALSALAEKRDATKGKTILHEDLWK